MKSILLGRGSHDLFLTINSIFQHGIICGGKGSGKHSTARMIIEGWNDAGFPSFSVDIANEFLNLALPARYDRHTVDRAKAVGVDNYSPEFLEISVWRTLTEGTPSNDEKRIPGNRLLVKPSSLGPELLSYLLNLKSGDRDSLRQLFNEADSAGENEIIFERIKAIKAAVEKFVARNGATFINLAGVDLSESKSEVSFDEVLANLNYLQTKTNVITLGRVGVLPRVYTSFVLWLLASLIESRQPRFKDNELASSPTGINHGGEQPLLLVLDEAQLLFERGDYFSELGELLHKCSKSHIGVIFITNSLAEVPKNIRDHLGFVIHHNIRGRSKKDKEGIDVGVVELPLQKLSFASAVTELRHGEALIYIRERDLNTSFGEWVLLAPTRSRDEKITDEEISSLNIKEVGKRGVPNPYSNEGIVKERIKIAASLAGAASELDNDAQPASNLKSSAVKSILRGELGVKLK